MVAFFIPYSKPSHGFQAVCVWVDVDGPSLFLNNLKNNGRLVQRIKNNSYICIVKIIGAAETCR